MYILYFLYVAGTKRNIDTSLALRHARFVNKLPHSHRRRSLSEEEWRKNSNQNPTKQPTLQQQIQWQLICGQFFPFEHNE